MGKNDDVMCRRLCKKIEEEGKIHAYDLIQSIGITIGKYYSIKGYFEHHFVEYVEYNKQSKTWWFIKKVVEEQQTLPIKSQEKEKCNS